MRDDTVALDVRLVCARDRLGRVAAADIVVRLQKRGGAVVLDRAGAGSRLAVGVGRDGRGRGRRAAVRGDRAKDDLCGQRRVQRIAGRTGSLRPLYSCVNQPARLLVVVARWPGQSSCTERGRAGAQPRRPRCKDGAAPGSADVKMRKKRRDGPCWPARDGHAASGCRRRGCGRARRWVGAPMDGRGGRCSGTS